MSDQNLAKHEIVIAKRFQLLKLIGEGSFGQVFLALDKHKGKSVAVKCE